MKHLSTFILFLCTIACVAAFAQKKQDCPKLNNRIVVNGNEIFSVKKCVLHPILDPSLYNKILIQTQASPLEISNAQYAQFSIGNPYTERDFESMDPAVKPRDDTLQSQNDTLQSQNDILQSQNDILQSRHDTSVCKTFEHSLVSTDNISFYYIESCKKRKFLNYSEVELFRNLQFFGAIRAISNSDLSTFKNGATMDVAKVNWNPEQSAIQIIESRPNASKICAEVTSKVKSSIVSHYGSIFYLKNCVLHQIKDIDIELMRQADDAGGIYELSKQEILALPQGTPWNKKN